MSRRDYPPPDRYDDRQSNLPRRPRTERNYEELDVDIRQSRYDGPAPSRHDAPPARRGETIVKERESDTIMTQGRRTERGGPRQPDFLREDYGRNSNAGPLVLREERIEEDEYVSRAPPRRRSLESMRSRGPPPRSGRVEKEEIIIRERESDGPGPPYPRSARGSFSEKEEIVYRDRPPRPPPSNRGDFSEEKIDIRIREDERSSRPPPPRSEYRERDTEEIIFRRGEGGRPPPREEVDREEITFTREERSRAPPPPREMDREEIIIKDTVRSLPPRESYRGRESFGEEIDIDIRERSAPPPRQRSMSRGALVRKDHEEWIVRRPRSPSPSPPPREVEREQIIIRRKERTPSPQPEPPREPTPEPPPPPPPEPIYRPPIIQEVITHHRHIDHGIERARSPTPPPPPAPPSPPKEEDLEISIRRQGTRNGKSYDEEITIERDVHERGGPRNNNREVAFHDRSRDVSKDYGRSASRQRSVGPVRGGRFDDEVVSAEADYYNQRIASRAYPGEAWNGATKDWGLVDIPPGTERVAMDGAGGGRQEITWDRYKGERRGKFYTGDRTYDEPYANDTPPPAPLPPPPERSRGVGEEIDIRITRNEEVTPRRRTRDRMWTEITKDLVIKEAIEEKGYEYEETDGFYYVMEYLQYEDVLKLVQATEEIRRERRERIRELQLERERPKMLPPPPPPVPAPPIGRYDEKIRETDYYYDRRRYR